MAYNWKKLKNAEVFGRGQYLKADFSYKLKLLKMFTIKTRNKGEAFIVDFEVMESTCPEIPAGQVRNWYQSLADESIAFPAIKEFLLFLFDIDQSDEEAVEEFEEKMEEIMESGADDSWKSKAPSDHPLNGMYIQVETSEKQTKKGSDFTVHSWRAWDGES